MSSTSSARDRESHGAGPEAAIGGLARWAPPRTEPTRALTDIYSELGLALLRLGRAQPPAGAKEMSRTHLSEAAQAFHDALRTEPADTELRAWLQFKLAEVRTEQNRSGAAVQAYLEAVSVAPHHAPEVLPLADGLLTVEIARDLAEPGGAGLLDALGRAALEGPAPVRAALETFMGRVRLLRGDLDAATEHFCRARVGDPGSVAVLEGLGEALRRRGDLEQAADTLRQAVALADGRGDDARRGPARLKLAQTLTAAHRHREAGAVVREALRAGPADPAPFEILLGECELELGNADEALAAAERVLARDAPDPTGHVLRAGALSRLGRYEEAVRAAEAALALLPDHPLALRWQAQALLEGGQDVERGVRLLQAYTRRQPDDAASQLLLFRALQERGEPADELRRLLERAMKHSPKEAQAPLLAAMGEVHLQAERPEEAISALERAAELDGTQRSARWWRLLGDAQRAAGDAAAARASYERALEAGDPDPVLLKHYGTQMADLGEFPFAAELLRRFVALRPNDSGARLRLAEVLNRLKLHEEALDSVDRAFGLGLEAGDEERAAGLKAEVLHELRRPSAEIVHAFLDAGQRAMARDDFHTAARLFEEAADCDPAAAEPCWELSEALRLGSALDPPSPDPPDGRELTLERALAAWNEGARREPVPDKAWVYVSRALMNVPLNRPPRGDQWWEGIVFLERALARDPWNAVAWATLGRFHRLLRNYETALHATGEGAVHSPEVGYVLEERAAVLADTHRFDEAESVLDDLRGKGQESWRKTVRAFVYAEQERFPEALELLADDVPDIWSLALRASCARRAGDLDMARADYRRVLDQHASEDFGNYTHFAWAAYHLGKFDLASAIFDKLVRDPADSTDALGGVGLSHLARGRFKAGEACLAKWARSVIAPWQFDEMRRDCLDELERSPPPGVDRTDLRGSIGRIVGLIEDRAAALQPPASPLDEMRAVLARLHAEGAVSGNAWIAAHAACGRLAADNRQWAAAVEHYEELAGFADRFPEQRNRLVEALGSLSAERSAAGDAKAVLNAQRRIVRLDPTRRFDALLAVAATYREAGRDAAAERHLRRARRCATERLDQARADQLLGDALLARGQLEEAERRYLAALPPLDQGGDTLLQATLRFRLAASAAARFDLPATLDHVERIAAPGHLSDSSVMERCAFMVVTREQHLVLADALRTVAFSRSRGDKPAMDARMAYFAFLRARGPGAGRLPEPRAGSTGGSMPVVNPLRLLADARLFPAMEKTPEVERMLDQESGDIAQMRRRIQADRGFEVPGVRIKPILDHGPPADAGPWRDSAVFFRPQADGRVTERVGVAAHGGYCVQLYELPVAAGRVVSGRRFRPTASFHRSPRLDGGIGCEPDGTWLERSQWEEAEAAGQPLWDGYEYMVRHLEAVVGRHGALLLGYTELKVLLSNWRSGAGASDARRALIDRLRLDEPAFLRLLRAMQALAGENVPLRQVDTILQTFFETEETRPGAGPLVERLRFALRSDLPGSGTRRIVLVPPEVEAALRAALVERDGERWISLPEARAAELRAVVGAALSGADRDGAALVSRDPELRAPVRHLIAGDLPDLPVLAEREMRAAEAEALG